MENKILCECSLDKGVENFSCRDTAISLTVYDHLKSVLEVMDISDRIAAINELKVFLHEQSPFANEPVDCVLWVKSDTVQANDYNPNSVAPPEMELLKVSIANDGYTQPIVTWQVDDHSEVVDGFHRTRVGKECKEVRERLGGYLPVVQIQAERTGRNDRIASTIRHNRARGKHAVAAMSDIVVELKRRNWSDERIGRELGMEQDEILRLCQITGLSELFSDQEFSKAWDVEGTLTEQDYQELTDDVSTYGEEAEEFRTVNTSDPSRVFHTYDKWECHKAGFYDNFKTGKTKTECEEAFRDVLSNLDEFEDALKAILVEWPHSCEHYLTNTAMNRLAWLGQAACCYSRGIPSAFRAGWFLLTETQQRAANELALKYLNAWLNSNNRPAVTIADAAPDRQAEIY